MSEPKTQPTHPHPHQVVSVQFTRSGSVAPGPRHPWAYFILIQGGHLYHVKTGFESLDAAAAHFAKEGVEIVGQVEASLARRYAAPGQEPYDWNVRNPDERGTTDEE